MQLKVGSYYLSLEGKVVGPMVANHHAVYKFKGCGRYYLSNGYLIKNGGSYDLIEEVDSKGQPLAHETLAPTKWGEWVVTKHPATVPFGAQTFSLPDGATAYRTKKAPIITRKEVLVASGGYNRYFSLEVVDGVVPDLLIKGSEW